MGEFLGRGQEDPRFRQGSGYDNVHVQREGQGRLLVCLRDPLSRQHDTVHHAHPLFPGSPAEDLRI